MRESRTAFGGDVGLRVRMLGVMVVLALVYAAPVAYFIVSGAEILVLVIPVVAIALAQLFLSDKLALLAVGAREVSPREAPGLHALVERLCIQADLRKPRVAVTDSPMPNAFAMGRSQDAALVCVTTGLMRALEPRELEAVVVHELAHIGNRDVKVMTIASFFATVALMIAQLWRWGRGFWAFALIGFAVYVLSYVLLRMLSRYRELTADRAAALVTGRPSALSSALLKISGAMTKTPQQDLRSVGALNAFFIVPTRSGGVAAVVQGLGGVLSTHPPIERRLAQLTDLERQLQSAGRGAELGGGPAEQPSGAGSAPKESPFASEAAKLYPAAQPDPSPSPSPDSPAPNWYPDPYRQARLRWWDGRSWTGHVAP